MHGNRDPLLGHDFARAAGATLLADPIIADVAGTSTLLSHGDAWCTRDVAYQQFRAMARNPDSQRGFLAKSVDERIAMAKGARMLSDTEKSNKAMDIMDVTPEAVVAALKSAGVRRIIHGHTHRPAAHVLDLDGVAAERWVLPDWDLDDAEPRGGYLDFVDGRPRLVLFRRLNAIRRPVDSTARHRPSTPRSAPHRAKCRCARAPRPDVRFRAAEQPHDRSGRAAPWSADRHPPA